MILEIFLFNYYSIKGNDNQLTQYFRAGHSPINGNYEFYQSSENIEWEQMEITLHSRNKDEVEYKVKIHESINP